MRVVFCHSDKPREHLLADAFAEGVRRHGDSCEMRALTPDHTPVPAEVACMVGVKSRELYRAYTDQGTHVVYLDKGYTRHARPGPVKVWEYWRVSLDAHHPTAKLGHPDMPHDRTDDLGLVVQPWRKNGIGIVIAGSSQKYHDFYGLRHPTQWAQKLVKQIQSIAPERPIIYRPKPSWKEAVPIEGTQFSRSGDIYDVLVGAWCLVTHGSNAVFEAVLEGVPCIVLGDAVAKPISSTTLEDIPEPRLATYTERHQWVANLSYWQWTMPEFAEGKAWAFLRPQIYG
jgi:hypothetical protein